MASYHPRALDTRGSLSSNQDTEKSVEWQEKDEYHQNVNRTASEARSEESQEINDSSMYPEGGLRAWGVVLGAFLVQFATFGYMSAFGVYQDYYTRIYMTDHSASSISWIGSTSAFILLTSGLFVGRLYDKGHCMTLFYAGAILTSFCLFMLSLVRRNHYVEVLFCQGIGVGLGAGLLYVPSSAIVSQYFNRRRGLVMPIVSSGVPLGSVVTPILINGLLQKPNFTFAMVIRINAGFVTAILVLACWLIKPRLAPPKAHANLTDCLKRFSRDGPYIVMTLGFTLFGMALFLPIFFLQLAAINHGLGKTFAFYSLVILNGSAFFGRLSCSILSHNIGVDVLATVSAIVCGGTMFAFANIGSIVGIVLVGVIYGFFFGLLVATMAPLTAALTKNLEELGLRLGIAFTFLGAGQLIGPPIMGALLSGYHWWRPAVFSGVIFMAAGLCFATIRFLVHGRKEIHIRLDV